MISSSRLKWALLGLYLFLPLIGKAQLSGAPAGVPVPGISQPASSTPVGSGQVRPEETVFRIRLIDGRNGQPLEGAHLRLWYDESSGPGFTLATARDGTALMPEPVGMPTRLLLATDDRIDCRRLPQNEPEPGYNLQLIAEKGLVLPNGCGDITAKSRPGELVMFARPLRWYENINRR